MTNPAYSLEEAGFTREQVDALMEYTAANVATKADIAELRGELKGDIAELRGNIKLHSWMLGIIIAGIFSLIVKAFFV